MFETITNCWVYEGPLYLGDPNEDGERPTLFDYYVAVELADGKLTTLTHQVSFRDLSRAEFLADRVLEAGQVDPVNWFEGCAWDGVKGDLAEADHWLSLGANEQDLERMGLA